MRFLDLPYDVLAHILGLVSPQDALELARTGRRGCDLAMARVLSNVRLGNPMTSMNSPLYQSRLEQSVKGRRKLVSFTQFLLSDASRHAPFLQSLEIYENALLRLAARRWELDFSSSTALAEAIGHAYNLRRIVIGFAEKLFANAQSIVDVLTAHKALRSITLDNIGPHTISFLSNLRSRPRELELRNVGAHVPAVLTALVPLADCLESLTLSGCFSPPALDPAVAAAAVFPRLHTLEISGTAPPLSVLTHAFPNTRRARISVPRATGLSSPSPEWVPWPSLDTLHVADVVRLPLGSQVRRIELAAPALALHAQMSPDVRAALGAFLARTQPVVLACTLSLGGAPAATACLEELAPSARSVRYLQLTRFDAHRDAASSEADLMNELQHLAGLPLVAVFIAHTVGCTGMARGDGGNDASAPRLALSDLAHAIAGVLRTVKFVGLSLPHPGGDDVSLARWFRTRSDEDEDTGERSVEEVPPLEVPRLSADLDDLGRDNRCR